MVNGHLFHRRTALKAIGCTAVAMGGLIGTANADGNESSTLIVDGGDEHYTTIQEAVDDAEPGDSIQVNGGTYEERVFIDKSVSISGDPGRNDTVGPGTDAPVIDGTNVGTEDPHPDVFRILEADGRIVIEGCVITNFDAGETEWNGIGGKNTGDVVVRDCHIRDVGTGIDCMSPFDLVEGWDVRRNYVDNPYRSGINLQNVSESNVSNNTVIGKGDPVSDRGHGIAVHADRLNELADGTVSKNVTIEHNRVLGYFGDGNPSLGTTVTDSTVRNLSIRSNEIAAFADQTPSVGIVPAVHDVDGYHDGISIVRNRVSDAEGTPDGTGIKLGGNTEGEAYDNEIVNNRVGIWDGGSRVRIHYNTIQGNEEWGINSGGGHVVEATCNYWGHATGPVHPDNPRPNPKGDPVTWNVEFTPWSVREIRDGEGSCTGGRGGGN